MSKEPDAAECAARFAISDILNLYCHSLDRRHWELMDRCFHPDATYHFGHIEGSWQHFVGMARTTIDPLRISHHQIGNIIYRVEGDRATTETYFTAYHRIAADAATTDPLAGTGVEADVVIAGRYIDRFERRDGDWRIAHRTGLTDWRKDSPGADSGLYDLPSSWRGSLLADDVGRSAVAD